MIQFFLILYRFFQKHKILFYGLLLLVSSSICYQASQIRFEEDINAFMPQMSDSKFINEVFRNVKAKDKIVFLFTAGENPSPDELIETCDAFLDSLQATETGKSHIKSVLFKYDAGLIDKSYLYVSDNLPVFLDSLDYVRLDSLCLPENLSRRLQENYHHLISPLSLVSGKYIFDDPLGLASNTLSYFNDLQLSVPYEIYNDHFFSSGKQHLIAFLSPVFGAGDLSHNEPLVNAVESQIDRFSQLHPDVRISWFGGIPIGVYNARQIKADARTSLLITLVLVAAVVIFVFRRKSAIFLILLPVLFGGVFALAFVSLIQGTVSSIAVGAGSAILGVALSYSIHVFCHSLHARSAEEIIRELAYPMTIGSFTTIGGFAGLMLSSSTVLYDFGLFSCFALIGTTLFCLVVLPHFLILRPQRHNQILHKIERFNAYPFEKNKYLIIGIALLSLLCFFFFQKVKFNPDMNQLTFMPKQFAEAETRLNTVFQEQYRTVYFVSTGNDLDQALESYSQMDKQLNQLKEQQLINGFSSANRLLIPLKEQERKIALWNACWTPEKKAALKRNLLELGEKQGFKKEAFEKFFATLDKNYVPNHYSANELSAENILNDWIDTSGKHPMLIAHVRLSDENKEKIYAAFENTNDIVILDKPYFAGKIANALNTDFNTILYIVSILVFVSILISYGRIEITLITFLPMALSWVIILGLMALFGVEFNIVNIIISTFIFGTGDDFSIFITDGLLLEYKTGKKILNAHKTAIFFSAFTIIAGLGALIVAKHPALHSVSTFSMLGMATVILISFTIQPFIFRLFISGRTAQGKFPYTLGSLLVTAAALGTFALGSFILTILSYLFAVIPIAEKKKKAFFHAQIHYAARLLFKMMIRKKNRYFNSSGEDFSKPGIIIANHQSVIDILQLLALHKKIIMVTKPWISRSPVFGRLARYADFVDISGQYEKSLELFRNYLQAGYSIAIFPEGSRSPDCKIRRFHKGAFFLSNQFQMDIIPVVLHGYGQMISKNDPWYMKNSLIACKILPRIPYSKLQEIGNTYQEQCKSVSLFFREAHARLVEEVDAGNPYYTYQLIKNYIYKGPVLEWYAKIKTHLEKDYLPFESLVPPKAIITDLGCGYGFLAYMLSFRSKDRIITGLDYDAEKTGTANHNFSKNNRLQFIHCDVTQTEFEPSDVFILNDVLHYLSKEEQNKVLQQCVDRLNSKGKIIIRDGDREKEKKHQFTRLTEFFSTRIVQFNKKERDFYFLSTGEITIFASQNGLSVQMINNDTYSSNTIYVLEKNG